MATAIAVGFILLLIIGIGVYIFKDMTDNSKPKSNYPSGGTKGPDKDRDEERDPELK